MLSPYWAETAASPCGHLCLTIWSAVGDLSTSTPYTRPHSETRLGIWRTTWVNAHVQTQKFTAAMRGKTYRSSSKYKIAESGNKDMERAAITQPTRLNSPWNTTSNQHRRCCEKMLSCFVHVSSALCTTALFTPPHTPLISALTVAQRKCARFTPQQ